MYSKQEVLDYLWQHSRFYHFCLCQSEELYREEKGIACIMMLFNCVENVSKSVINDYDARAIDVYKALFEANLITDIEHDFLNVQDYCIRKVRNLYSHANIAAIYLILEEQGEETFCPLTENDTSLLLYEKISDILYNLILKIISSEFIDEVKDQVQIVMDESISTCALQFKTLTIKELLALKGFPEDYFDGCNDIPEHAKLRLLDNAPDVGIMQYIFSGMKIMPETEVAK